MWENWWVLMDGSPSGKQRRYGKSPKFDDSSNYHLVIQHRRGKSTHFLKRETMVLTIQKHLFRLGPSKNHGELLVITRG